MDTSLIITQINLENAAKSLHAAYWTQDEFHIKSARRYLIRAICGPDQEPSPEITEIVEQIFLFGEPT